jgi:hypothetical protein
MQENPVIIAVSTWSIVFGGVVLCVFLAILYSNQHIKSLRKKHQTTHTYMPDADFLAKLNIEASHHDMCLDIRKAVAQITKVPAETLHPSESDGYLTKLGLTFEDLMLNLGEIGPYNIDYIVSHKLAYSEKSCGLSFYGNTFGDLIRFILNHLEIFKMSPCARE